MQNVGPSDGLKHENKVSVRGSTGRNNGKMSTPSNKFTSNTSSPTKSDTETFSEFQPRVTDSSESDEESVSEILLACLCLRPDLLVDSFPLDQNDLVEIPGSCSDSCENDDNDEEEEDDEDDEEDEETDVHISDGKKYLLECDQDSDQGQHDTKARLEALLEAADEAAQALNRMRSDSSPRDKKILRGFSLLSRSLIAACTDNDVNAVRRLLGEGNSTINEGTDDGESLLSLACSAGYYELAQVLLAMSAQVEDRGQKNDCTPLMEAASAGHVDIIKLLISHGADVNAQSSTGNTPLMYACAGGHVAAVQELLAHGANVEDHNENGHTPLMEAASAGHVEVAKILLEHGAGINTHSNEFKESALTLACYKGHLDMVRFLLEAGADQEHKTDEMHTALMEASMDGHVEVARLLLDSGAQVNMPTDSFESPLTLAACGGHVDLAMLLIERGANIEEVNDEGYTPLMEAAREGHEEMVALLLSQGANINAQTEETQETALTLACCGGFLEVADYLIKNGADIELGASTPLMEAAQEGHLDLVKFLLENNADVHAQTQTGDTALTYACENGHTEVAEVLLYYRAELEHESEGGRTPLMKACRAGHICTVKFLIAKGADVNRQTTNNDHTPLSLACAGGHQAVVELLLKSGADPFYKLKDNSTMLIEAAKGGHIGVVQLLLDYPHSMSNANQMPPTPTNVISDRELMIYAEQQQKIQKQLPQPIQPIVLHQPKQQQAQAAAAAAAALAQNQQLVTAPPGLHDVPEAIRVSNHQMLHQQQLQGKDEVQQQQQQQMMAAAGDGTNVILDSVKGGLTAPQTDSILAQMRMFQMQAGFTDGLAQGLALAQPGVVNQIVGNVGVVDANQQLQQQQQQHIVPQPPNNVASGNQQITAKQKGLSRKGRPSVIPYDSNLTTSEAQQVRSQPLGEDENSIYVTTTLPTADKKILEEFHKTTNLQVLCEGGVPSTLLPSSAYVDITTPSAQGGKAQDNTFLITTSSFPTSINQSVTTTTASGSSTTIPSTTPSTQITAPSEVSQNTAISDRPKVKPVSKKDGKGNIRKSGSVLQQNQMVSIYNNLPVIPSSEQNLQLLQQSIATLSLAQQQQQQQQPGAPQTLIQQQLANITQNIQQISHLQSVNRQLPPSSTNISQQQQQQQQQQMTPNIVPMQAAALPMSGDSGGEAGAALTAQIAQNLNNQSLLGASESDEQLNSQWNQKMWQMVAQLPNHPLQKIAQRVIADQPKSPTEGQMGGSSSGASSGLPTSPNNASKNIANNNDYSVISRMISEVVHGISSDLNPEFVQQHQQEDSLIHQKALNVNQQFLLQQNDGQPMVEQGDSEDHLHMFSVDDSDAETIGDCEIYPALDESLESLNVDDVTNVATVTTIDGSKETICNYEWADYIDDAINALHGGADIPVAIQQEMAANLNCPDLADAYAMGNLMGISSFCKTHWGNQWAPAGQPIEQPSTSQSVVSDDHRNQIMTFDHQLHQQIQQQLSVEQLQLLTQLQNQQNQSLSMIPTSSIDQQHLSNANITSLASSLALAQQSGQVQQSQLMSQLPATLDLQQQQQQQNLSGDAQQQTKFVFNVDIEKQSPALQLLFQMPAQQQQQQQQAQAGSTVLSSPIQQQFQQQQQQIIASQIAQTQTSGLLSGQPVVDAQQSIQQVQLPSNLTILQPHQILSKAQQMQNCSQAVATQTQQLPSGTSMTAVTALASHQQNLNNIIPSPQLEGTVQPPSAAVPAIASSVATSSAVKANGIVAGGGKKGSDKTSRKESKRYSVAREAPAGSQVGYNVDAAGATAAAQQQFAVQAASPPDKTIDVDSETDSNHDTALTLACAGGHEDLVELLISRGANIEHRDKKGFTPLILAATAGHDKVVEALLKYGAEMEAQSERTKDTPLSLACSGGRYEVVELLLNIGANKEHRNVSDYTPLSLAASGGYVNIIKLLLSHGAEINSRTGSKLGISPLMLAAMNGHTQAVKLLLDMGSDINAQIETNRNTALTLACFQGRHEVVNLLLERKANVEHRAKTGLTPLMEAASGGYIEVGRVLLDKGADVNAAPVPSSRDTALTIAADKGHVKFVELLLYRGAAVEVKNKKGNSPLWLAANGGHLAVVEILYAHDADIDSQDNRKVSCLMAAFRKGHTKVVKWMVNHVTQFPSDQEMTRYISTVSDKELLDKCHECVKVIRAAKEAQAVKANKNASILLEELDKEKNREESRKAAAARRRERKKKKKLEKKEEKRKLNEPKNAQEDKDDDKDDDSDNEKDESSPENAPQGDKEEGDSGIDANSQGSCSSADVKSSNLMDKQSKLNKAKKRKEKNVPAQPQPSSSQPQASRAKSPLTSQELAKVVKKEEIVMKNMKSARDVPTTSVKGDQQKEGKSREMKQEQRRDMEAKRESMQEPKRSVEKENLAPKEDTLKLRSQKTEKKPDSLVSSRGDSGAQKSAGASASQSIQSNGSDGSSSSRKVVYFPRHLSDHEILESTSTYMKSSKAVSRSHTHEDSTKSSSVKQTGKREEGWKEVVRKSSVQQQVSSLAEPSCKKVAVPTHAISRVIGRGGSNINAIRAATGAHIEVEKQGKSQCDRWITIKGSLDATRQAHSLIGTLIKDPDVDILQMLQKVNANVKPVPPSPSIGPIGYWGEKSPVTTTSSSFTSASSAITTSSNVQTKVLSGMKQPVASSSKPLSVASSVAPTKILSSVPSSVSSASRSAQSKVYQSSHQQSRPVVTSSSTVSRANPEILKRPAVSTSVNVSSGSNTTKTTMSFTGAIMSLKSTTTKNITPAMSMSGPPGTFASKLLTSQASDVKKILTSSAATTMSSASTASLVSSSAAQQQSAAAVNVVQISPKHHNVSANGQNLPAPFANASQAPNVGVIGSSAKPPFSQTSIESSSVSGSSGGSSGPPRSITPIGPPTSRNVTQSPLLQKQQALPVSSMSSDTALGVASVILQSGSSGGSGTASGIAAQLQTKISQLHGAQAHEYSLFNDSYGSQWENKQMYNNVLPLQADASKAPGYRGNTVSSPVSLKTSSQSITPPSSGHHLSVAPSTGNVASTLLTTTQSQATQNLSSVQVTPSSQVYDLAQSATGSGGVIKPPTTQIQPPPPSNLAVQRPIMSNMAQARPVNAQMDSYSSGSGAGARQNLFDNLQAQSSNTGSSGSSSSQHMLNYSQNSESSHPPPFQHLGGLGAGNLHMSRLNPRATVFSSMQQQQQAPPPQQQQSAKASGQQQHPSQFGNIFQQNQGASAAPGGGGSGSGSMNSQYSKMPPIASYNPTPGRPQSQPQPQTQQQQASQGGQVNNGRWYDLSHLPSPREILNMENGFNIGLGSPSAMSPNNPPQATTNGVLSSQSTDDSRKMPRPIGTERASWKYGYNSNVVAQSQPPQMPMEMDNAGQIHPWMVDKQPWMMPMRNQYMPTDDLHPHDHFSHMQLDYHAGANVGPSPQNMNLMQSLQYTPFMPHADIGQLPDKIETWEPEKHGWKWTN
ncbi:ankyrin repeat and KH domain-containing protein mask isoform X3 [Phlebotomus argentipes]|uniref:ankyrin repeat and KH domain-containing protein mask isoform X3 n=1 Tax=Phlebotomus argentipes TaxID=94469 RepID=UPI0028936BDF|nr:ankyrin repeat and KH domain-containing protein mask isoform X3 [Phlebotomus argentipes]